jgi:hypothetical protein
VERSLSAEAVFAEIMSIIKGSTGAMRSSTGYLSRQDYMELPAKAGAVAGIASIRSQLYALFLKYQEVKRELNCYDLCDVIFAAYSALAAWKIAGPGGVARELPIHSILVDEVQDCSQACPLSSNIIHVYCLDKLQAMPCNCSTLTLTHALRPVQCVRYSNSSRALDDLLHTYTLDDLLHTYTCYTLTHSHSSRAALDE